MSTNRIKTELNATEKAYNIRFKKSADADEFSRETQMQTNQLFH